MRRKIPALTAMLALLAVAPCLAADWSLGLRWNWIHMSAATDFWDAYVGDKWFDEYEHGSGEWTQESARGDIGLVDDFNGPNAYPALKASLKTDRLRFDLVDAEYYQRDRRITKYTYQGRRHGQESNESLDFDERLELTMLQIKHGVSYLIQHKGYEYYLGGGLNWTVWETDSTLRVTDYTEAPADDYPEQTYQTSSDGLALGAHLTAGVEYALTPRLRPFFGLTYLYAADEWNHPDEFDSAWNSRPDDFRFTRARKGTYDLEFTGLRMDFGLACNL